jgi:cytochrome c6
MVLRSLFIISVVGMLGCESSNSEMSGKELFSNQCAVCHGMDGKMGSAGAKDLSKSTLTDEEIQKTIEEGKNTMPAFMLVIPSDTIMKETVKYVKSLRK